LAISFRKNLPAADTSEVSPSGPLQIIIHIQKNMCVAVSLVMIFLMPLYSTAFQYAGVLSGLITMFLLFPFVQKTIFKKSLGHIRMAAFLSSFLFLMTLGLHARTFEWSA